MGARVLAVTTSPQKLGDLEALPGVDTVPADSELDFSEIVLALTEDEGADVVLNPVGSALFGSCVASMAQFGRMVVLGEIAGRRGAPQLGRNPIPRCDRNRRDRRITAPHPQSDRPVASGKVQPVVSRQFTFDEAPEAIDSMRAAAAFGRVALIPPAG